MNDHKTHKIIVACGMAVVAGIAIIAFALRPHPVTAQVVTPPAAVEEFADVTPATPAPVTESLAAVAPESVPQIAEAPAAPVHKVVTASKPAVTRHLAKADNSAVVTRDTVTRIEPATAVIESPAVAAVTNSIEPVSSTTELATAPAVSSTAAVAPSPIVDQTAVPSGQLAATDSQITNEVKTEIAVDTLSKDVAIGVITINGVVALTGSLASQDAIDHVKEVVARVKDVKSVDTSALVVLNL